METFKKSLVKGIFQMKGKCMSKWNLLGLCFVVIPFTVSATFIDFTDPSYAAVDGVLSIQKILTIEGYEPWNTGLHSVNMTISAKYPLAWLGEEGIGNTGHESEYIDGYEWITFAFDDKVYIDEINLSDFYMQQLPKYLGKGLYNEAGWYMADGDWNTFTEFNAAGNTSNPYILQVDRAVKTIQFAATGSSYKGLNEYGIMGFNIAQVPDAGIVSMFGAGLLCLTGLFFSSRKRKA